MVRRGQNELVGLGVPVDGRKTEVLDVVGPPRSSNKMFQSVHPTVPLLKSWIMLLP